MFAVYRRHTALLVWTFVLLGWTGEGFSLGKDSALHSTALAFNTFYTFKIRAGASRTFEIPSAPPNSSSFSIDVHCLQCRLTLTVDRQHQTGSDVGLEVLVAKNISSFQVTYNREGSFPPVHFAVRLALYLIHDVLPGGCFNSSSSSLPSPGLTVLVDGGEACISFAPARADSSSTCPPSDIVYWMSGFTAYGVSYNQYFHVLHELTNWASFDTPGNRLTSYSTPLVGKTLQRFSDALPGHGYIFSILAQRPSRNNTQAYFPSSLFRCSVDSIPTSDDVLCPGVLQPGQALLQELDTLMRVDYTYSQQNNANASNETVYVILQAHTQAHKLHVRYQASPRIPNWTNTSDGVVLDTSLGVFMMSSGVPEESQVAIQLAQHGSLQKVPVLVLATTGGRRSPVPGGCGAPVKVFDRAFSPGVRLEDAGQSLRVLIEPALPAGVAQSSCADVPADRLTYTLYRVVLNGSDVFSTEKYMSTMKKMILVEGILKASDAELILNISNATQAEFVEIVSTTSYGQLQLNTGAVFVAMVTDNELNTRAAYAPAVFYRCEAYVNTSILTGPPCKYILSRARSQGIVRLVDNKIMTFQVDWSPAANRSSGPDSGNGFAVVQTHCRLHRVRASPYVYPLLGPPPDPPSTLSYSKADVMTSRNTGIVVNLSSSGNISVQFDYFAALYSLVEANAQVKAMVYPRSAPLPGGCREDGASALLTVVFNGTMVTVSFTGAAVFLEGQWVCANAESWLSHGVNVTYDLYVLQLNTSSERDLFQGISKMYAVQDIRRHATKVRTFPAGALQYSASLPVRPGLGRVYGVVASVVHSSMSSSSRNDGGDGDGDDDDDDELQSAYIPASSYDCDYVNSPNDNGGQICKTILFSDKPVFATVNRTSNLSMVLNDWRPGAAKWTFVVMTAHSQRDRLCSSLTMTPTLDTAYTARDASLLKLLNVKWGNEQALLYISRRYSSVGQGSPRPIGEDVNTNVMVIANPYTENVPIPGGCCLTCSLDIDPNLNITYSRYSTSIVFHPANIGYYMSPTTPCYERLTPLDSRLRYYLYRYELAFIDFSESAMFDGLIKMSTPSSVERHGTKVALFPTTYVDLRRVTLPTSRGTGTVYSIIVVDHVYGTRAVYPPSVSYGCEIGGRVLGCDSIGSVFGKVVLTLFGLVGLVLVFFGHRLYLLQLFVSTFLLGLLLAYPLFCAFTHLDFTARIGLSLFCGGVTSFSILKLWKRTLNYRMYLVLLALPPGFLFAALLLFTPFGNISAFHSPATYWLSYVAVTAWFPVVLLYMPVRGNLILSSWVGGYAVIIGIGQYVKTSLIWIILDVILHAVESQYYTKNEYHDYYFTPIDIGLSVLWALLTIVGAVFQHRWLKRHGLLSMVALFRLAAGQEVKRDDEEERREEDDSDGADPTDTVRSSPPSSTLLCQHASTSSVASEEVDENTPLFSRRTRRSRLSAALRGVLSWFSRARQTKPDQPLLAPGEA